MATIVLVHGIGNEQYAADLLESTWLPALAGGIRTAGHPALADRIWRHGPTQGGITTRMAFYGDLFLTPDAQSADGDLPPADPQFEEALAREWLLRARARAASRDDRETARLELADLADDAVDAQGIRSAARSAVGSLSRIRQFASFGMSLAERFVLRSLRQVTAYFTNETVRSDAIARVEALIDDDTRAIVGHSLGSCIAFEVAHRLSRPLPLLLTLGSPIGLGTIVFDRLRPQPPTYPALVRNWVNIADRNDIVAAEPDLWPLFGKGLPAGARLNGSWTVENGSSAHDATFYLTRKLSGQALAEVLLSPDSRAEAPAASAEAPRASATPPTTGA